MRKSTNVQCCAGMLALTLGGLLLWSAPRTQAEPPAFDDAAQFNTLTPGEQQAGWVLLFDGKTTKGWHNYREQAVGPDWKVVDGALVRSHAGAGDLVTVTVPEVLNYRCSTTLGAEQ